MIENRQKFLLHHYKRAAGLSDPTYRNILREKSSVSSSADRRMTQSGFERTMAALETTLFQRVHSGEVPNPLGADRWIRAEFHWRGKAPERGVINSRQAHKIDALWRRLCEFLDEDQRNVRYLGGILYRATGRSDVGYSALKSDEAAFLIDALQDRLAHAIGHKHSDVDVIPF